MRRQTSLSRFSLTSLSPWIRWPIQTQAGVTLIETMIAVIVVAVSLLGVLKLMSTNQRSVTESMAGLQAQASAEELLQSIRKMNWDEHSPTTGQMPLAGGAFIPKVKCSGPCPSVSARTGIEHWSQHSDNDNSRPIYGRFRRRVRVRFLDRDANGQFFESAVPTHRKEVTIWAVGRNSSATLTSVFYNLP